jgi:hypothetical protein
MNPRALSLAALTILPLVAAGCFGRGSVMARRIEQGPPLAESGPAAYRLWHDGAGWHVRVHSDVVRRFHGVIEADDVRRLSGVDVPEDAVRVSRDRIAFSFLADEEAGFDFRADDCLDLSLYVDGDPRPLRVDIGRFGASPARVPYTVCR